MAPHMKTGRKAQLAELLNDCSIDRVMAIDKHKIVIAWNHTSEIVSGINAEDIIGKYLFEVLPEMGEHAEIREAIELALEGHKTFVPSDTQHAVTAYYENHFIPLKNEEDEMIGVMNIMHDVAHRIKVEDQLKKLNKALTKKYEELEQLNNELASFTYITGRELKEPLQQVYSSFEQIIRNEAQHFSHGSRANLRKSQSSVTRMSLLVDDILALAQLNNYQKEKQNVDLNAVMQKANAALQNKIYEKQAVISLTPLPSISGYEKMLEQLFINVLDNSLKFQKEDSVPQITVEASVATAKDAGIKDHAEHDKFLKICFSDNGIGFDTTDAKRIFLMYEKLHPKNVYRGSGIGLTVCKKIAEAHDGFMTAESEKDKGAKFCLYLPVGEQ